MNREVDPAIRAAWEHVERVKERASLVVNGAPREYVAPANPAWVQVASTPGLAAKIIAAQRLLKRQ